jgi:hypothetical protein
MPFSPLLGSQKRLANTILPGDRSQRELRFGAGLGSLVVPRILGKELAPEAARKSVVQRVGLANLQSIKRPGHGIEQIG